MAEKAKLKYTTTFTVNPGTPEEAQYAYLGKLKMDSDLKKKYGKHYNVCSLEGKWGVIDSSGKVIVPTEYDGPARRAMAVGDGAVLADEPCFVMEKDDKETLIGGGGKEIFGGRCFDHIWGLREPRKEGYIYTTARYALLEDDGRKGVGDIHYSMVLIEPRYRNIVMLENAHTFQLLNADGMWAIYNDGEISEWYINSDDGAYWYDGYVFGKRFADFADDDLVRGSGPLVIELVDKYGKAHKPVRCSGGGHILENRWGEFAVNAVILLDREHNKATLWILADSDGLSEPNCCFVEFKFKCGKAGELLDTEKLCKKTIKAAKAADVAHHIRWIDEYEGEGV